jgi:uncharacterized protein
VSAPVGSSTPTGQKRALITGASSGIGKALAFEAAAAGYQLILSARRKAELDALASAIGAKHTVAIECVLADLATAAGADALAAAVQRTGPLDVLINNAGYGLFGEFKNSALDDELAMMQLNMHSLTILTKRLLPGLLQTRGKIMNVASTAAFQPGPLMAVYYATKAYVLSFSEALAEELSTSGVSVTALCPGPTASGFQDRADMHASALVKGKKLPTSAEVARYGFRAMRRGQRVAVHGTLNWLMVQSLRLTPRRVVTWMVNAMSKAG